MESRHSTQSTPKKSQQNQFGQDLKTQKAEYLKRFESYRNFKKLFPNSKNLYDTSKQYEYSERKVLGKGAFGIVYEVIRKEDKKKLAMKKVILGTQDIEEDALKEVRIMEELDEHIHIMKLEDYFFNKGSLKDLIQREYAYKPVLEKTVKDWMFQICLAIRHLHFNGLIHRDIKPENILVQENLYSRLIVSDFGISKKLDYTLKNAYTNAFTEAFKSPEQEKGNRYSFSTDIWALGVLLYYICTKEVKYNHLYLYQAIARNEFPSLGQNYSKEIETLFLSLLEYDPKKRPNISEILQNPIISSYFQITENAYYEGQNLNRLPNGIGSYYWTSGPYYQGEWKEGLREGYGVYQWQNGQRYESQWKNDNYNGVGIMYFPRGEIYKGEYKYGLQDGKGYFKWKDGHTYEGDYKMGKREGQGVLQITKGYTYKGQFANDKRHGDGEEISDNGKKFKVKYHEDKRIESEEIPFDEEEKKEWEKKIKQ